MCDERRELKNQKLDVQGVSQYTEINSKIREAHETREEKLDWRAMWGNQYQTDKEQHKTGLSDCKRPHNHKTGRTSTTQDKSGKSLTEDQENLSRWTEYYSDL